MRHRGPDSRDGIINRPFSTELNTKQPTMFRTSGAHETAIRRITAALSWALMLQLSLGSIFGGAAICATAPAGQSTSSSMTAMDHHHGTPSREAQRHSSCAATFDAGCPMPAGTSSNCSSMTSCATVVAEPAFHAPDENTVPARHIAAGRLVSPRAWVTAPDHPPPRA